jgi:hypothetical protein
VARCRGLRERERDTERSVPVLVGGAGSGWSLVEGRGGGEEWRGILVAVGVACDSCVPEVM